MSFTRLNWDNCTYKQDLKQSIGPADYILATPQIDCQACFPPDPAVRLASRERVSKGGGVCADVPQVDVESELWLLNRKASNCPTDKYMPRDTPFCTGRKVPDCQAIPREDTRLSNPTCTMRCTGINRWQWLCKNPQDKSLVPFDFNISNRIVVKDNHRPCIQEPINQAAALPPLNQNDDVYSYDATECMGPNRDVPSTHWRNCKTYAGYA
jgi:hypothetical protein